MTPVSGKPGDWIVRMNHRNRSLCFAVLFIALGSHMASQGHGPLGWTLLAVQFLVYPHLLFLRARRAPHAGRAELNNMVLDTLAFGAWAAALGFPLWIAFILFVGATVNLGVFRGPRGVLLAMAMLLLGALVGVMLSGFRLEPATSPLTTALSIACMLLYLLVVAQGAYVRALKLHETKERLRANEQALQTANAVLRHQLDEINALQSKLTDQANRDPLTGLYNRRYLDATIERELARSKRYGRPLSVMLVDIDHFKRINDTYGHQAGDEVLKALAAMLHARETDVACRYGGEEFLLFLPDMPLEIAVERAEFIRARCAANTVEFGEFPIRCQISVGIACYPDHGTSAKELIRHADQALYRAKDAGRNRVVVAAPALAAA